MSLSVLLSLSGCFLWSTPAPERPCDEPHLWYAPDASGDVYFGCLPPEGWGRTPVDESLFATPPTATPSSDPDDTGVVVTEAWVPPPVADTAASLPPDTASEAPPDTGAIPDPADTGALDTGLLPADSGGVLPDTGDTGLPGAGIGGVEIDGLAEPGRVDPGLVDTGLPLQSLGGVRIEPEQVEPGPDLGGLGGVVIGPSGEILPDDPNTVELQPGEILVGTPDGIKVLTPADTGYFIQRDQQGTTP